MDYKYLFGPVPSRRLGISLGIDLVENKTCNFNCVYCECGAKKPLDSIRKEYVSIEKVLDEVRDYISKNTKLDYITFSGSGEPTLNKGLGKLAKEIKKITDTKICLITNSSILSNPIIHEELENIDVIMPSLDAVFESSFLKIDRPHKELKLTRIIEGLVELRKNYKGKIWLEIFMLQGINDTHKELNEFAKVIKRIEPDKIQLNTLDRPAPVKWVEAMPMEKLEEIKAYFYENGIETEIIKKYKSKKEYKKYNENYEKLILNMLEKRPCTLDDLVEITRINKEELGKYIDILLKEKNIITTIEKRGIFYRKK